MEHNKLHNSCINFRYGIFCFFLKSRHRWIIPTEILTDWNCSKLPNLQSCCCIPCQFSNSAPLYAMEALHALERGNERIWRKIEKSWNNNHGKPIVRTLIHSIIQPINQSSKREQPRIEEDNPSPSPLLKQEDAAAPRTIWQRIFCQADSCRGVSLFHHRPRGVVGMIWTVV